jgi:hypothetical protein
MSSIEVCVSDARVVDGVVLSPGKCRRRRRRGRRSALEGLGEGLCKGGEGG